jgi:hypothetical protein
MEPIRINLRGKIGGEKTVNIVDMIESDEELLIKLRGIECYNIYQGQTLTFTRFVYYSGTSFYTISESVDVIYEDNDHIIHTTKPSQKSVPVYNGFSNIEEVLDYTTDENGELIENKYHIIRTVGYHNIFPQDLVNGLQEVYIKDGNGNILFTFDSNNISVPLVIYNTPATSADCITLISEDETCGKKFDTLKTYQYDFANEKISRDSLIIRGLEFETASDLAGIDTMTTLETKFNPFYYYYILTDKNGEPSELDENGNPVKHCRLYSDPWWEQYELINNEKNGTFYVGEYNGVVLTYSSSYWDTDIGLSTYANESTLGFEDNFNTKLIEDIEESLIPDFIDMERIKYSPMVYSGNSDNIKYYKFVCSNDNLFHDIYTRGWINSTGVDEYGEKPATVYTFDGKNFSEISGEYKFTYDAYGNDGVGNIYRSEYDTMSNMLTTYTYNPTGEAVDSALTVATSITLSFHFRKRQEVTSENNKTKNSALTSGHVYTDGWFIDESENETTWWNGMDYGESAITHNVMDTFIKKSGTTSDLIGYLNFVDNDVLYRKKKVSKTFVRLSFYNSKDPIEQKLLFYSTVFLDSTSLYGNYVKQMMYMEENGLLKDVENMNVAVVMYSASTDSRVDTKMVITNEFDRTKSAEGFNIYLFAKDRNINLENGEKTIYMKVEFNHAGNGKTLPMIMWPKVDNEYVSLTIKNFLDSLYIPIKLTYINGRYVYYIPDAYKNENGNIDIVLFEPKIDILETDGEIKDNNS